jgi:hypothetical protein
MLGLTIGPALDRGVTLGAAAPQFDRHRSRHGISCHELCSSSSHRLRNNSRPTYQDRHVQSESPVKKLAWPTAPQPARLQKPTSERVALKSALGAQIGRGHLPSKPSLTIRTPRIQ